MRERFTYLRERFTYLRASAPSPQRTTTRGPRRCGRQEQVNARPHGDGSLRGWIEACHCAPPFGRSPRRTPGGSRRPRRGRPAPCRCARSGRVRAGRADPRSLPCPDHGSHFTKTPVFSPSLHARPAARRPGSALRERTGLRPGLPDRGTESPGSNGRHHGRGPAAAAGTFAERKARPLGCRAGAQRLNYSGSARCDQGSAAGAGPGVGVPPRPENQALPSLSRRLWGPGGEVSSGAAWAAATTF